MNFMIFLYRSLNDESNNNVITARHFSNVVHFHRQLTQFQNGRFVEADCVRGESGCLYSAHIVEFFQDSEGNISDSQLQLTDRQILLIVNAAKSINLGTPVLVEDIFGGTEPA